MVKATIRPWDDLRRITSVGWLRPRSGHKDVWGLIHDLEIGDPDPIESREPLDEGTS